MVENGVDEGNTSSSVADLTSSSKKPPLSGTKKTLQSASGVGPMGQVKVSDLHAPSEHSPITPYIVSKNKTEIVIGWTAAKGAKMYNAILDGTSIYSGSKTQVKLPSLKEDSCYRVQVAYFSDHKWSPLSHALHVNNCGLRIQA